MKATFLTSFQLFLLSLSVLAYGEPEHYSARPDISQIVATQHEQKLPSTWAPLKEAHLNAVAQLIELYPDRQIYFLARDAELFFDFAKTILEAEPKELSRIHLLNVSRANMRDPHIKDYLDQEKISDESLREGKKILFVDTGFSGTIPRNLSALYKESFEPQIQTHLMMSSNIKHPSSRVFSRGLYKGIEKVDPSSLHSSIIAYEHMPRFTYRATKYEKVNGKWEPTGKLGEDPDGQVSKELSQKYREDLKYFALSEQAKINFQHQRKIWRALRKSLNENNEIDLKHQLSNLSATGHSLEEAIVRDFLEFVIRNEPAKQILLPSLKDLKLPEIVVQSEGSNKNALIVGFPNWKHILENPSTEIPKLVKGDESQILILRNIIDTIQDKEIEAIIVDSLMRGSLDANQLKQSKKTLNSIIENKPRWHKKISLNFQYEPSLKFKQQLALLIEKGDDETLDWLVQGAFGNPHSKEWGGELQLLISRGLPKSMSHLPLFVFSKPHSAIWKKEMKSYMEKADPADLDELIKTTFTRKHSIVWKEELRHMLEKMSTEDFIYFAGKLVTNEHMKVWKDDLDVIKDRLTSLIKTGDCGVLEKIVRIFRYSQNHKEALSLFKDIALLIEERQIKDSLKKKKSWNCFSKGTEPYPSNLEYLIQEMKKYYYPVTE